MALDPEIIIVVKKLTKEFKFNEAFEKSFLRYLEEESDFQLNDDNRLEYIDVLRKHLED